MARPRKPKKDRTSLVISAIIHVFLIGGVIFWAYKTGKLEEIAHKILQVVTDDKKKDVKKSEPIPPKQQAQAPKLPPINQGVQPTPSRGTRMAVASDAPQAEGSSFFQDTRRQVDGPSTSGGGASRTNTPTGYTPPLKPPAPRPVFGASKPSSIKQLLADRAQALASTESVGAEQISKSGSSDAGGAVTKVAGASIVDGKFAVIRGLSDRYVSVTLNGVNLPSADPYRQSAPLDLFPAQVIDKVVVSKTFTPDKPGAFTGGGIDIVTKSFPEKTFFSMAFGAEYNTQASLNDRFLAYQGGKLDWAGMDDGTRALPSVFDTVAPITANPKTDPAIPAPVQGNVLTNSPNLAKDVEVNLLTKSLGPSEFAPHNTTAPLNGNFSFAGGGTTHLFDRPLGYFASGGYKQEFFSYEDGISRRYQAGAAPGVSELKNSYRDARSLSTVNWSAMANLAYQPWDGHELDFLFFYNQNSVDDSRIQQGIDTQNLGAIYRKFNLFWTQRNLNTYQMMGKHDLPSLEGFHFDWLVGLTQTTQEQPDARYFNDVNTGSGFTTENGTIPSPNKPTRQFTELAENNRNVKLDWTLPFPQWTADEGKFKFGLFDNLSTRTFTDRQIYYNQGFNGNGPGYYYNDPNQYLTDAQVNGATFRTNAGGRTINVRFNKFIQAYDSEYNGQNDVRAGYLMLELPLAEKLRLVGGVRYETTDYSVYSASYLDSSVTGTNINNAVLQQADWLPSAGLIYALKPNMNFRLNYSQTLARPSYRELAAYYAYDPVINEFVEGNPELQMTSVANYDARWEWFPRPGELVSVSLFYKSLQNAIERGNVDIAGEVLTYFNRDSATLYGVELEARKNLDFLGADFKSFSLGGNLSLLQSQVKLTADELFAKRAFFPDASDTRQLYDQSPYILNLDLNYENPYSGTLTNRLAACVHHFQRARRSASRGCLFRLRDSTSRERQQTYDTHRHQKGGK